MQRSSPYAFKPGTHSYNAYRLTAVPQPQPRRRLSTFRFILFLVGLVCLGYYAYTVADQKIYQAYENWAFDQQIAGRPAVTFRDYVREQTPFGFLAGTKEAAHPTETAVQTSSIAPPVEGSVIGRVTIGRLNLSAVVRQGVDSATLRTAVGHVPSTALPGAAGNFAIAAHRDTLFRALKDIQKGDLVTFQSPSRIFNYQVVATRIVKPSDVSVLRPDGGGLIQDQAGAAPKQILTMITCYPFYYVGSAPKRFVVEAQLADEGDSAPSGRGK
jgi:sortase A